MKKLILFVLLYTIFAFESSYAMRINYPNDTLILGRLDAYMSESDTIVADSIYSNLIECDSMYLNNLQLNNAVVERQLTAGQRNLTPGIYFDTASILGSNFLVRSATYGDGKFVGVTSTATQIFISSDGREADLYTITSMNAADIVYVNGLFVATGSGAGSDPYYSIWTSPDAITWTVRNSDHNAINSAIAYGNNKFVVVGGDAGSSTQIAISSDAITWTSQSLAWDGALEDVAFGKGIFVAVGNNNQTGVTQSIWTSPDGVTWTERTSANQNALYSVEYGNNVFVACSYDSANSNKRFIYSSDGITWAESQSITTGSWYKIAFGDGVFVACGYNTTADSSVIYSNDGVTWRTCSNINHNYNSVVYGNGTFLAFPEALNKFFAKSGQIKNKITTTKNYSYGDHFNFGTHIFDSVKVYQGFSAARITAPYLNITGSVTVNDTITNAIIKNANITNATIDNLNVTNDTIANAVITHANVTGQNVTNDTITNARITNLTTTSTASMQGISNAGNIGTTYLNADSINISNGINTNRFYSNALNVNGHITSLSNNTGADTCTSLRIFSPTYSILNVASTNNTSFFWNRDDIDIFQLSSGTWDMYLQAGANFIIQTSGSNRFQITSSGNVGIGTVPTNLFDIYGDNANDIRFTLKNNNCDGDKYFSMAQCGSVAFGITNWVNATVFEATGTGGFVFSGYYGALKFTTGISRDIRMYVSTTGDIGINNSNPQSKLHVTGKIKTDSLLIGTFTNGIAIDSISKLKIYGSVRPFDILGNLPFTSGKGSPTWTATGRGVSLYQFALDDSIQACTVIGHRFAEDDTTFFDMRYATNGVEGSDKYVNWSLHYFIINVGDTITYSGTLTKQDTILANTPTLTHKRVQFDKVYTPLSKIGASVVIVIKRIASTSEPAANPFGSAVNVLKRVDALGSNSITTK